MLKRDLVIGFGSGLIVGLVTALGWFGGHALPRVAAQAVPRVAAQAAPAAPPQYQMATWAYPATAHGTGGVSSGSFGVFILDTQTGKTWQSKDGGKLQSL